ncbi:uncharacterized protein [Diabrotica undecimpunctata]|uniref:uncharacterized protein n=1 Tax=Diabrotica undecimpunctata TaxID=50387 RepID=UPI003B6393FF
MEGLDLALLQEPWLHGGKIAGLKPQQGKLLYDAKGETPRACIVYGNEVNCTLIPDLCSGDFVTGILTASTEEGSKRWLVCSAYFAGEKVFRPGIVEDVITYSRRENLHLILGCDANAHHLAWGSTNINSRGESLLQFILSMGLEIANIGNKPTFVTATRKEVLDVTLCSEKTYDTIKNWHVSEEPSCSDHRHIRFDLITSTRMVARFRNPRETDWEGYRGSLEKSLEGGIGTIKDTDDLELTVETVRGAVLAAYQENCPEREKKGKKNTPWWNEHLQKLRADVRRLFNKAKFNQDWAIYREKLTQYNKEIRKAKRDSWRKFCEEVEQAPACSRIHKVLAKDGIVNQVGLLKKDDETYVETLEESLIMLTKCVSCRHIMDGMNLDISNLNSSRWV